MRPGLPKRLLRLVDRALSQDPGKRPSARELADELRGLAGAEQEGAAPRHGRSAERRRCRDRAVTAALGAALAGWTAAAIPFFPPGWPLALGAVVVAATLVRERLGIALALAVPIFPIGNFSCGRRAPLRRPRGDAPRRDVAGAALDAPLRVRAAPRAALRSSALLPLATVRIAPASVARLVTALGVLTAAVVAGIDHGTLPLVGGAAPLGNGLRGAARNARRGRLARPRRRRAPRSPPRDGPPHRRRRRAAARRRQGAPLERRARRGDAHGDASRPARRRAVLALRRARSVFHRGRSVLGACASPSRSLHSGKC